MAPLKLTWDQVLAWRMRQQFIEPPAGGSAVDVVRRLAGVQAQVASSADLAVRARQAAPLVGEVGAALAAGALMKTWAMRGTLHLLAPHEGAALLALMASGRSWERPSWQRYFGVSPREMDELASTVVEVLDGRALTREELVVELTARTGHGHLAEALRSGWGTVLKPLAWQGHLCYGPSAGNRVTFARPDQVVRDWHGLPSLDEAAGVAIPAYLGAHGPATPDGFGDWLAGGWFGKRRLGGMFAALADRLAEVDLEGGPAWARAEDIAALAATPPTKTVRLLPGFDQYVLGPGTADEHVIAAARRSLVSKTSGWIAPVVVAGGRVAGTWLARDDVLEVDWFSETGAAPRAQLGSETERMAALLDRQLRLEVRSI